MCCLKIKKILNNIKRIELHGHGEPLLVKDLAEKIRFLKQNFKNAQILFISTLGYELSEEFLKEVLSCGLNVLRVSFYGGNRENYKAIHGVDRFDVALKNLKNIIKWNKELNTNVHIDIHTYHKNEIPNTKILLPNNNELMSKIISELSLLDNALKFNKLILHNYGNGNNFIDVSNDKSTCSVAFADARNFLQISYGLNVIPCSMAFNDEFIIGNLKNQSLKSIFSSLKYKKFQKDLINNNLANYDCCKNCCKFHAGNSKYVEFLNYYLQKDKLC